MWLGTSVAKTIAARTQHIDAAKHGAELPYASYRNPANAGLATPANACADSDIPSKNPVCSGPASRAFVSGTERADSIGSVSH